MYPSKLKNILIILLIVFIAVPFLGMIFNVRVQEGLESPNYVASCTATSLDTCNKCVNSALSDSPDTQCLWDKSNNSCVSMANDTTVSSCDGGVENTPFNMDRTNITNITGGGISGEFLYCPAGNITCPSGTTLNEVTDSDYTLGKSFNFYCNDSSGSPTTQHIICNNSLKNNSNALNLPKDCNNNEITFRLNGITTIKNISGADISGLDGFIKMNTSNIPMDVSGDYVILYKDDGSYSETKKCFLEHGSVSNCCEGDGQDEKCEENKPIKCLANNNAQIGDPLCCGQSGVVQDTKYNCPSELLYCLGYKCGESWGNCSATAAQ